MIVYIVTEKRFENNDEGLELVEGSGNFKLYLKLEDAKTEAKREREYFFEGEWEFDSEVFIHCFREMNQTLLSKKTIAWVNNNYKKLEYGGIISSEIPKYLKKELIDSDDFYFIVGEVEVN